MKLDGLGSHERVIQSGEPIVSLTDNTPSHLFELSCHYIPEWVREDSNYSRTEIIPGNVRAHCPDRTNPATKISGQFNFGWNGDK